MRKKTGAVLLITLLVVSTTTACGTDWNDTNTDRNRVQNVRNNNDLRNDLDLIPDRLQTRANSTRNADRLNGNSSNYAANRALADKIAKKAATINGVDKATVVVNGNDALVGIDVKKGKNVQATENLVRNSVKNLEPGIDVHITGDRNIHGRISKLQSNLQGMYGGPDEKRHLYGTNSTNGARDLYETKRLTQDNINGLDQADGMRPHSVDRLDGTRMYNADGPDGLRHPIRTLANDVREIIDDIGDAVTAPLRPLR